MKKKIVILSGAGISAESGISTFRDSDGLWEKHDVMEVASIFGWQQNPSLGLDFYNQRRAQLKEVKPNKAHLDIASLEKEYDVVVITQNVDNLHEMAGSTKVIHLHGELTKVRPVGTSLVVQPAASLWKYTPVDCPVFVVDPKDTPIDNEEGIAHIKEKATVGVAEAIRMISEMSCE